MSYRRRRVEVIDPHHHSEEEKLEFDKVPVIGGKKYCPRDGRLLVLKPDSDMFLCADCGFTLDTSTHKSGSMPSILSESRHDRHNDNNNISMKLIPVGGKKEEEIDPDIKRMQDKGYVLQEYYETKQEIGTYNAQQEMEERQKLLSRSRYNSWSVR